MDDASSKIPAPLTETKKTIDKEVYWLRHVFYKSAYFILLCSWVHFLTACFIKQKCRYLAYLFNIVPLSYPDDEEEYNRLLIYPSKLEMEMRDIAAGFLFLTYIMRQWPESISEVDVPLCSGTVVKRRNRVAQTTGPYLKRFRQGLRHLEEVSDKLKADKRKVTRRWKKVYFKYAMAERMLLCDIRSKEKLIGFLRAKMQCSLAALKEVTSSVKVSRDRLEVQREENKTIIDQLEYYTQIAQIRQ